MKGISYIGLLLLLSFDLFSTAQYGDKIILGGDTLQLFTNPLEQFPHWYCKVRHRVDSILLAEDMRLYPQKYESDEVEELGSSACWRGYIATWQIIDKKLYLLHINACHNDSLEVDLNQISVVVDNRIFAEWFCGKLIIPKGKMIEYIHLGYYSIYERKLFIKVKNGEVKRIRERRNR